MTTTFLRSRSKFEFHFLLIICRFMCDSRKFTSYNNEDLIYKSEGFVRDSGISK